MKQAEKLTELYRQLVVEHGRQPRRFIAQADEAAGWQGGSADNSACGDRVTVFFKFDDQERLQVCFTAAGCALLHTSASVLGETLEGLEKTEGAALLAAVVSWLSAARDGIPEHPFPLSAPPGALLEGAAFFPARLQCVLLPWQAAAAAFKNLPLD